MRTLRQNYDNVLIYKFLHVSVLIGPSPRNAQLYETIIQQFNHPQCAELSQVRQCMFLTMDMCTIIGAACRFECVQGTRNTLKLTSRNTLKLTTRNTLKLTTRNTLKLTTGKALKLTKGNTLKRTKRNTLKPAGYSKYCALICLYTHTLTNLRQLCIFGMI